MAKNFQQKGDLLDYQNENESTINSGDAVLIGKRLGVAITDIAPHSIGAMQVTGVFNLPKAAVDVAVGSLLYWQSKSSQLTMVATGNTAVGYAFAAAVAADLTMPIKINA